LFAAGGIAGGLGLGFGLALLLELRDRTLRTERDIKACLRLPTLAMVPSIKEGDLRAEVG
jgi:capsular polysaccharide biosynthesis protein